MTFIFCACSVVQIEKISKTVNRTTKLLGFIRNSPMFVDRASQELLEDCTDCSNVTQPGRTSIVTPSGECGQSFSVNRSDL